MQMAQINQVENYITIRQTAVDCREGGGDFPTSSFYSRKKEKKNPPSDHKYSRKSFFSSADKKSVMPSEINHSAINLLLIHCQDLCTFVGWDMDFFSV